MPSLTRNVFGWQEIAKWCQGPGFFVCGPTGETIASSLRQRGTGGPEVPLTFMDLSTARYEEILKAEQQIEAERNERIRVADQRLAEDQES